MLIKPILNPIVQKILRPLIGSGELPPIPPLPPFVPSNSIFIDFTGANRAETVAFSFVSGFPEKFSQAESAGWTLATKNGSSTLKSKDLDSSQSTYFDVFLDFANEPNNFQLEALCSLEKNYDKFRVYIDLAGTAPPSNSNASDVSMILSVSELETEFKQYSFSLDPGVHRVTFQVVKDQSVDSGDDAAYLKSVSYKKAKAESTKLTRTLDFRRGLPAEFYQAESLGWSIVTKGGKALRAKQIGHSEKTSFDVMLDFADEPNNFILKYLISTELFEDKFNVYIDDVLLILGFGVHDSYYTSNNTIAPGLHKVTFEYAKSYSGSDGDDTVYIKSLTYISERTFKTIEDLVGTVSAGGPYIDENGQTVTAPPNTIILDWSKGFQNLYTTREDTPHIRQIPQSNDFRRGSIGTNVKDGILSHADEGIPEQYIDGDFAIIKAQDKIGTLAPTTLDSASSQFLTIEHNAQDKADPYGTFTATKFLETSTNSNHTVTIPLSRAIPVGNRCNVSMRVSPLGRKLALYLDIGQTGPISAIFDTETKDIQISDETKIFNATLTVLADGWFNLYAEFIKVIDDGPNVSLVRLDCHDGDFPIYAGDVTKGVYIAEVQSYFVRDDWFGQYGVPSFRLDVSSGDYNQMDVQVNYYNGTSDILPHQSIMANYFPATRLDYVSSIDIQDYIPYERRYMKFLSTSQIKIPRLTFNGDFGCSIMIMYYTNPNKELRVLSSTYSGLEVKIRINNGNIYLTIGSYMEVGQPISSSPRLYSVRFGRVGKTYYLEVNGRRVTRDSTSTSAEPAMYMDSFGQEFGGSSSFNDIIANFNVEFGGIQEGVSRNPAYLFDQDQDALSVTNANGDAQPPLIRPYYDYPDVGEWFSARNNSTVVMVNGNIRNTFTGQNNNGVAHKIENLQPGIAYFVQARIVNALTQGTIYVRVTTDSDLATAPNDSCNIATYNFSATDKTVTAIFTPTQATMYFGVLIGAGKVNEYFDIEYSFIALNEGRGAVVHPGTVNDYILLENNTWQIN